MRYERPTTMKQASVLLTREKGSAYVLAGGTDLLVRMRTGFVEPDLVVDIKRIPATREIAQRGLDIWAEAGRGHTWEVDVLDQFIGWALATVFTGRAPPRDPRSGPPPTRCRPRGG